MVNDWADFKLSEVINLIGGGTPKRSIAEYWGGDIPWLSVKDFNNEYRHVEKSDETITKLGLEKSSTKLLERGQIIISARGTVGELAQVSKTMAFNQSCYGIDAKTEYTLNDFLYYLLKHSISNIQRITHGAVFDTITRDTFNFIEVSLPPLTEQKAIAYILGSLDDKIELNRQMNETLEAMAQALFKSWFVDFDPVIDNALAAGNAIPDELLERAEQRKCIEKKDSSDIQKLFPNEFEFTEEMGWIPKGWEVGSLDNMFELQRGFDLPKTKRTDGFYPLMAASGQDGTHDEYKVKGPGVITGRSGKLGIVSFVNADYWPLNTTLWVKNYNQSNPYHAYFFLQTLDLEKYNSGSAVPSLNRNNVHNLIQILPSNIVLDKFQEVIESSFAKIAENNTGIETLAKLRDTLLPKLMSGEIRIPDAAAFVENI